MRLSRRHKKALRRWGRYTAKDWRYSKTTWRRLWESNGGLTGTWRSK